MSTEQLLASIVAFLREYHTLAAPTVFILAFGESLAFVSLVLPFWAILVGIGTALGAAGLSFVPIWVAASLGAACGDWLSYWLGKTFKYRVARVWPLSKYPRLLPLGRLMFQRYGWLAVVIGRFTGPLRASIPLVAGICNMPQLTFQLANFGSAFLWAGVLLSPGSLIGRYLNLG